MDRLNGYNLDIVIIDEASEINKEASETLLRTRKEKEMGKQKLKTELQAENHHLQNEVDGMAKEDYRIRKEFSRVFGSYPGNESAYSRSQGASVLSWEEIFFRIGEIKNSKTMDELTRDREKLEHQLRCAKNEICNLHNKLEKAVRT